MALFTHSVAFPQRAMSTTAFRSGTFCRSVTLALVLALSFVSFVIALPSGVRRQQRLGHSRIPRTVLRTILSDGISSVLSSSPHPAPAWAREGFRIEIRQSGILIGHDLRI